MRRLLFILIPLLFAAPSFAQQPTPSATPTPTNPPEDKTCGLPKEGTIVANVIYTLKANCTQTGALEIKTDATPNVRLTINGKGHTIYNSTYVNEHGETYLYNFLVVSDDGVDGDYNLDNSPSPNVKVIIKDVTFDGKSQKFRRHPRLHEDGHSYLGGYGSGILTDGPLTMENVTFTQGNGVWVRARGTATLKNVLFKDSYTNSRGFSLGSTGAALHVTNTGKATLHNAVLRDIGRTVISIENGGKLTTTGCLSFIRVWSHKVHHGGLYSGMGTWSDKSSGACQGKIGNGGQAVVSYSPQFLDPDCGMPVRGYIEGTVVYTLTRDCVCVAALTITAGARVTINANGFRIVGCSNGVIIHIGNAHLTIDNAIIEGVRLRNFGGIYTLRDSTVKDAYRTPIINFGWAYLSNSIFEDNQGYGDGEGKSYYAHGYFRSGRALFRDLIFRNNVPRNDEIEAYTSGSSTAIYLCGDNILDGAIPTAAAPFFKAVAGGGIFGCPGPGPSPTPAPVKVVCLPGQVEQPAKRSLGAIGVILYVEKCPLTVEIWEILPNSQGQFALAVSQSQIEAASEGLVACSANGRAAVRVGMTEPVRQIMAYSKTYKAPSERGGGARDILISVGPTFEQKVHHLVIDHALDGTVMGAVDTRPDGPPCEGADAASLQSAAGRASSLRTAPAPPPQPTPIPVAAPVTAQPAREDGSIVHVVQPGDTLWAIGVAYDVHPYRIISLNQLEEILMAGGFIVPGQELLIRRAS